MSHKFSFVALESDSYSPSLPGEGGEGLTFVANPLAPALSQSEREIKANAELNFQSRYTIRRTKSRVAPIRLTVVKQIS